jgi:hypothetical protein
MRLRKRKMKKRKRAGKPNLLFPDKNSNCEPHSTSVRAGNHSPRVLTALGLCIFAHSLLAPRLEAKAKPLPTKTISGAVLDPSNNSVSGASVFLTDLETHRADAIYSGQDGTYSFSGLNPNDDYQLQAKLGDRVSGIREASSFDTRNPVIINLVLNPPGSKDASGSH